MHVPVILAALGASTLVPYIILRSKKQTYRAIFLKISISLMFLLATLSFLLIFQHQTYMLGRFLPLIVGILAGQIMGLCGDFWLDLKDIHPEQHDPYVFSGFSSFLIGHIAFIGGMSMVYDTFQNLVNLLIALGAGVLLAGGVLLTEKPMKLQYGKFKTITAGYSFVFGFVIATAFLSALANSASGKLLVAQPQAFVMGIGLVLFLLSDLVLSGTFFGKGKDRAIDYTLNYIFYFGAQFTISLSLLWLV